MLLKSLLKFNTKSTQPQIKLFKKVLITKSKDKNGGKVGRNSNLKVDRILKKKGNFDNISRFDAIKLYSTLTECQ